MGVLLGTVLAAAVLTGSLLVGDSVDGSLRKFALQRLGHIQYAMHLPDRLVDRSLAKRMDADCAAALLLRGMALTDEKQINRVQVIDAEDSFFKVAGVDLQLHPYEIALNNKLAQALGIGIGEEVSLRMERPGLLPGEAPLSAQNTDRTVRGRFKVVRVLGNDELGRFGLAANQVVPYNAFVNFQWSEDGMPVEDKANLIISSGEDPTAVFSKVWNPADFGLTFREESGVLQLESSAVYLEPEVARAALSIPGAKGSLTYLVNSISFGERSTPYSFVLAEQSNALKDDEIVINRWLATELDAVVGDVVQMKYSELVTGSLFVERERDFRVAAIIEMKTLELDRKLAPQFPGLTDVDRCTDWDVGIPMEEDQLEDEANEAYWNTYRQTPKAIVSLKAGQQMWANRFGSLTGIRWKNTDSVENQFLDLFDPAVAGYRFVPVREQALESVEHAMDFGQLFVGMSFFLIVAALMLTGLLFVFGVQKRAEEMGILLASGWRPSRVRNLFMLEGGIVAFAGSLIGSFAGIFYTHLLILGLSNYWKGAIANSSISLFVNPGTVLVGAVSGFVCASLAMWISIRRQSKHPARELLMADFLQPPDPRLRRAGRFVAPVLFVVTCGVVCWALTAEMQSVTMPFFSAGGLMLIAGIMLCRDLLSLRGRHRVMKSPAGLALRTLARRKGRSLTVIGLLACGSFLVFAVSSMKEDIVSHADEKWSGTGGFVWFGESTLPLRDGLDGVNLRVLDGDDASCLNLNRARQPQLLGVDPSVMSARQAFILDDDVWELLKLDLPEGIVPALVGDVDTGMWGLEAKVGPEKGDVLDYVDESGRAFKVKLVGSLPMRLSVFQGSLLISEKQFIERFPSEAGYRIFLLDEKIEGRRYERAGLDLVRSVDRLLEFYAVESTYLAMFLVLGIFGLMVGSAGVGIVVLRNVLDRRGELALLKAVGYRNADLRKLLFVEHGILVAAGLAVGIIAAAVAMVPALFISKSAISIGFLIGLLLTVVLSCLLSLSIAVGLALKEDVLSGLRNE
ncbi:ABC transporter permease [Pontiellaceae bacterium B1224]|nr:ABC transporter permease [Pontiellaceae bacterium B1224]